MCRERYMCREHYIFDSKLFFVFKFLSKQGPKGPYCPLCPRPCLKAVSFSKSSQKAEEVTEDEKATKWHKLQTASIWMRPALPAPPPLPRCCTSSTPRDPRTYSRRRRAHLPTTRTPQGPHPPIAQSPFSASFCSLQMTVLLDV